MTAERIVVGMSGGVDSSVAALLLKREGFEVVGLFMKNWEDDDDDEYCASRQDLIDCASVADVIGIDLDVVNFAAEYKERVFANFLAEYSAGRTPNPDVLCNAEIKFKAFLDHAIAMGAQRMATGHYAAVRPGADGFELLKAADRAKDQSYFLHRLDQRQLERVVFPLAGMKKAEVRQIARQAGLPVHSKRDSTGICFVGERPFREFLGRYLPRKPGPMRTPDGRVVGEHIGLAFYTVGQRKGIGLGGMRGRAHEPWYVAAKDLARNELIVVQGREHALLFSSTLRAADLAWVSGRAPHPGLRCTAKTRYRQADAQCLLGTVSAQAMTLEFAAPQWAVAPGQSAVLYSGEVCLGGGVIQFYSCGAVSENEGLSESLP
jgi:tRNA-specific 2-thiouridylase